MDPGAGGRCYPRAIRGGISFRPRVVDLAPETRLELPAAGRTSPRAKRGRHPRLERKHLAGRSLLPARIRPGTQPGRICLGSPEAARTSELLPTGSVASIIRSTICSPLHATTEDHCESLLETSFFVLVCHCIVRTSVEPVQRVAGAELPRSSW